MGGTVNPCLARFDPLVRSHKYIMKIYYQDEYGEELYTAYNKNAVPRIGETVIIEEEEYKVRDVIWKGDGDDVIVEITQNLVRAVKETKDDSSGRLAEMQRAIVAVTKRQDGTEKKNRILTEQVVTLRTHINQRIQQERKES